MTDSPANPDDADRVTDADTTPASIPPAPIVQNLPVVVPVTRQDMVMQLNTLRELITENGSTLSKKFTEELTQFKQEEGKAKFAANIQQMAKKTEELRVQLQPLLQGKLDNHEQLAETISASVAAQISEQLSALSTEAAAPAVVITAEIEKLSGLTQKNLNATQAMAKLVKETNTQSEPAATPPLFNWLLGLVGAALLVGLISVMFLIAGYLQNRNTATQLEALTKAQSKPPEPTLTKADLQPLAQASATNAITTKLQALETSAATTAAKTDLTGLAKQQTVTDLANEVGMINQKLATLETKLPKDQLDTLNALKASVNTANVALGKLKTDDLTKQITQLDATLKAKPTGGDPMRAVLPGQEPPLDVAIVFCHSKLDGARLVGVFKEAITMMPAVPNNRIGFYFARDEEVTAVRKLTTTIDVKNTLTDDLRKLDKPDGLEKPGPVVFGLRNDWNAPNKVVVLVLTPAAEVPDVVQWGDAKPYVLMVQIPGVPVDTPKLQQWVRFVSEREGMISLLVINKPDDDGYKLLERNMARQLRIMLQEIRRIAK